MGNNRRSKKARDGEDRPLSKGQRLQLLPGVVAWKQRIFGRLTARTTSSDAVSSESSFLAEEPGSSRLPDATEHQTTPSPGRGRRRRRGRQSRSTHTGSPAQERPHSDSSSVHLLQLPSDPSGATPQRTSLASQEEYLIPPLSFQSTSMTSTHSQDYSYDTSHNDYISPQQSGSSQNILHQEPDFNPAMTGQGYTHTYPPSTAAYNSTPSQVVPSRGYSSFSGVPSQSQNDAYPNSTMEYDFSLPPQAVNTHDYSFYQILPSQPWAYQTPEYQALRTLGMGTGMNMHEVHPEFILPSSSLQPINPGAGADNTHNTSFHPQVALPELFPLHPIPSSSSSHQYSVPRQTGLYDPESEPAEEDVMGQSDGYFVSRVQDAYPHGYNGSHDVARYGDRGEVESPASTRFV